jgi:hypothetical protein
VIDKVAEQTPIYYAARKGLTEMCRLLIEKGADITHIDSSKKTAVDWARKNKFPETAEYLLNELRRYREVTKYSMASQSLEESNLEKRKKREENSKHIRQTYKIVQLNEKGELRDLTEEEVRQMAKCNPQLEAYLSNPESIPAEVLERGGAENWEKVAMKVMSQVNRLKGSYWFQEPVDPNKFGIVDYFDVISHPMDLGTLRKKLTHNCYGGPKEFASDMALIWQNCYRYNGEEHDISKCAKEIETAFKDYYVSSGLQKYETNQ